MWIESKVLNLGNFVTENFIQEIFKIEKEVFEKRAWSLDSIRRESSNPLNRTYLLVTDDDCIGYLLAKFIFDEAEILRLSLKRVYQGKGLALKLWRSFLKDCYELNIKKVFLEVSEKNINARKFYKKIGFCEYGKRKDYYDIGEDALILMYNIKKNLLREGKLYDQSGN